MRQLSFFRDTEEVPPEYALCITGHRPGKLPDGEALAALSRTLYHYLDIAIRKGFCYFYLGLADGIDYIAAEYLFQCRKQQKIRIIGVQPCEDYREFFQFRGYDLRHLDTMLENVDKVYVLSGNFRKKSVFLRRNCYMVDHSSAIIAVCAEGRSGSMQTYRYAKEEGLGLCRIFPDALLLPPEEWHVELDGF